MKVGVISDSVNQFEHGLADSVATGDLPKGVQIIQDGLPGDTDEGRAMLEEIHDIAPGATLAFATAGQSQETLAHNITALVRAGCSVIVDDIGFFDEPFFQGGVVDQAITNAVEDHGVVYLSSARNGGFAGFQTNANWVTDINGRTLLDWDPSDNVDTRMRLTVNGLVPITFGWNEPFNGVVGAADVDLDINFIDPASGVTVVQGVVPNLITGIPEEVLDVPAGTYDVEVSVADKASINTPLPTVIRLASSNGAPNLQNITDIEYPLQRITTSGHNAGQDTISVGAVPWYLAPPFNNSQTVTNEDFSSAGPVQYFFKQNGTELNKPITILKPDVSGIDGINTSFFGEDIPQDKDKLPNFFGTSAASPNVAAVVALMRELNPDATPAEIKNALITSAKTNPVNGQVPGSFNPQAGFGLDRRFAGVARVGAGHGRRRHRAEVVPDSVAKGVDKITIRFSEPVVGFSLDDLSMTRGKNSTENLLTEIHPTLTTTDNQTFVLGGLGDLTSKRGTYFLTFTAVGVVDAKTKSHPSIGGATSFFVNGKPTGLTAIAVSELEIDLSWTDNTPKDTGFTITRALDANFTLGVRTFTVKTNVAHFKDTTGLSPTTQYFYKVRANVDDGAPNPSTDAVNTFTLADNENIVDNRSLGATIVGGWTLTSDTQNAIGGDYLAATPKGTKSVTFTPDLSADGTYFVYVRSIKGTGNATNAKVQLLSGGDVKKSFTVNQRTNNGWVLLGSFKLPKGTATAVRVVNDGADGTVVADAVRFQRNSTSTAAYTPSSVAAMPNLFSSANVVDKSQGDSGLRCRRCNGLLNPAAPGQSSATLPLDGLAIWPR